MVDVYLFGQIILIILASMLWGLSLWYFSVRVSMIREVSLHVMAVVPWTYQEIRACILGLLYLGIGAVLIVLYASAFDLSLWGDVPFGVHSLIVTILGAAGEVSMSSLLVSVFVVPVFGSRRFGELWQTPWIRGVYQLPFRLSMVVAAFSGALEELFFRGIVFRLFVERFGIDIAVSIGIVTAVFLAQQMIQVRSIFAAAVIGLGCVAISVVGAALVVSTGSTIPAVLCHASFVLFFLRRSTTSSVQPPAMAPRRASPPGT